MGEYRGRLIAAFASLAIASTSLGFIALPAAALETTTTTSETTSSPSPSLTAEATPPAEANAPAETAPVPTPEQVTAEPVPAETSASATTSSVEPAPSETAKPATAGLSPEATAGGSATTGQALFSELPSTNNEAPAYDRALFNHWIDADGDGCNTRAEVLIEESEVPVTTTSGCTVTTGQWTSPYDGAVWTNASDVDIDHMIPLAEAWRSIAWSWTAEQRTAFANDMGYAHSLVAVTDNVNQSKGDQDPATWMPTLNQCEYVISWVSVKWRWNIGVDAAERSALGSYLNGTECGSRAIPYPGKMINSQPAATKWPLYKIVYDATIFELVTGSDGTQNAVPLTYEKWRDFYRYQQPAAASTDFVKYPWSPTVYAVTFWPGGESKWLWTRLSYQQWQTAKNPTPRIAGWIKGSYYYQWGSNYSEVFVRGEDGINHKLTLKEWEDSGRRSFQQRHLEGFVGLTWAPELARMTDFATKSGRPLGFAEWQAESFPTPRRMQRIEGDQFYQDCGNPTVYYAGPGMNRAVTFQEWQAAGSPAPTIRNAPCGGSTPQQPQPQQPSQPAYPGDSKNCNTSDFPTWRDAQNWFDYYYPYYGDVARLDSDGDRIACEGLPGAP